MTRRDFCAELGEFVMAWNRAEAGMRQLLVTLAKNDLGSRALTPELGMLGLQHGLQVMASSHPRDIKAAVDHLCEIFDRLREYRNYYAHGLSWLRLMPEPVEGVAYMISAKGKMAISRDYVTPLDLTLRRAEIVGLQEGISDLLDAIDPQIGSKAHPPLPSPQTLPLPDRLQKTRVYPPLDPRQPRPSLP